MHARARAAGGLTGAVCLALTCLAGGCGGGPEPEATPEQLRAAVRGNNDFAARFYARASEQGGNLCVYAYGLRTALSVLQAGASGNTAYEMAGVVGIPRGRRDLHEAAGVLARRMRHDEGRRSFRLRNAEAVLVRSGRTFLDDYRELIDLCYPVGLHRLGLGGRWGPVLEEVNEWAAERTGESLSPLAPPDVTPKVGMAVAVAGTVLARWAEPFDEDMTAEVPFARADAEPVPCLAMHGRGQFRRAEFDEASLLELPYRGGRFSLVLILPSARQGLAGVQRRLRGGAGVLETWLEALEPTEMGVVVPVFRVETDFRAEGPLRAMGLGDCVTTDADFSGMVGEPGLYLAAVLHRAALSVHQKGSGGDAARAGGPRPVPEMEAAFRAERPFAFVLRHVESGAMLFIGQLTDPGASGGLATAGPTR